MKDKPENRQEERLSYKAPVMLYAKDNSGDNYSGHIYNQSQGGMYIRTDGNLKGNQCYLVKISNNTGDTKNSEEYTQHFGIVRWAQFVNTPAYSDSPYKYGYGLEFTELATCF